MDGPILLNMLISIIYYKMSSFRMNANRSITKLMLKMIEITGDKYLLFQIETTTSPHDCCWCRLSSLHAIYLERMFFSIQPEPHFTLSVSIFSMFTTLIKLATYDSQ